MVYVQSPERTDYVRVTLSFNYVCAMSTVLYDRLSVVIPGAYFFFSQMDVPYASGCPVLLT
jgi:hypothetical protein